MKLVIFHYHFLTGGVTTVVRQAVRAIRTYLPEIQAVQLAGGRAAPGLAHELARDGIALEAVPEIDYQEPPSGGRWRVAEEGRELAAALLARFGGADTVWWVHNHHLGKNLVFTQALLQAAQQDPGQRLILLIHDFPECGRQANLRRLRENLSLPPYPLGANLRYAVLTPRDRTLLLEAGVPEAAVFLLANPVPPAPEVTRAQTPGRRRALGRRLAEAFGDEFPGFAPQQPIALYPVRTIRRKNVLEACLLAALAAGPSPGRSGEGLSLVVTLPGISAAERPYSDRVEALFRSGRCRGLWGIGARLAAADLSFAGLVSAADLVVSSAVQEGFGYLFINSLQWRRPLLGRNLDILEGTRDLFVPSASHLYDRLVCPLQRGERRRLREAYLARIAGLADLLTAPESRRLEVQVEELAGSQLVDFSYLAPEQQEQVLARLTDPGYAAALQEANPVLTSAVRTLPSARVPDFSREIDDRYGLRRYAAELGRVLDSFALPTAPGPGGAAETIQQRIVARFARLEHLRLLYD